MRRIHAIVPAAALGLVLLLSACAERGDTGAAPAPATTTPPTPSATATLPDDGNTLVLQVTTTGGFVAPETLAGRLPVVSVYADGRVISQGPVAAIYPGPAWPNLQLQQTDRATVQTLADQALAAGVADTTDLGRPGIADAPSTRFTLTTASGTAVREVYALAEGAGSTGELTAEQQAARDRLADLLNEATDLPGTHGSPGEPTAYQPAAVAALVRPWTAPAGDPSLAEQPELPWPGPALPGEETAAPGVTCVLATGDQATAVTEAARGANQLTPWSTGGGARWSVVFRPLLPDETGCADLTR